jgi:hypothetical protein
LEWSKTTSNPSTTKENWPPVLSLLDGNPTIEPSLKRWSTEDIANHDQMQSRILSVERAMAGFLGPDTAQL